MKILSSRFASVATLVGIAVAAPPTLALSPATKYSSGHHPTQFRPVSAQIPYAQPRLQAPLPLRSRPQLPRDPRWGMMLPKGRYPATTAWRPAAPAYGLPRLQRPTASKAAPRAPMFAQRPPMPRYAMPKAPQMARMAPPRAPMFVQRPPMPRYAMPRAPQMARMAPPRAPMFAQRPPMQGFAPPKFARALPTPYSSRGLWRPTPQSSGFVAGMQTRSPVLATPAFRGWQQARPQFSPRIQDSRSASIYRPKLAARTDNPWRGLNDS